MASGPPGPVRDLGLGTNAQNFQVDVDPLPADTRRRPLRPPSTGPKDCRFLIWGQHWYVLQEKLLRLTAGKLEKGARGWNVDAKHGGVASF